MFPYHDVIFLDQMPLDLFRSYTAESTVKVRNANESSGPDYFREQISHFLGKKF